MIRPIAICATILLVASLRAQPPVDEQRVVDAARAADSLATAADSDLTRVVDDGNRNSLSSESDKGGTVRSNHAALRTEAERTVIEMGEIKGRYAEAALRIRELWHTADAAMELALGVDPINDDFEQKADEHRAAIAKIRGQLRPLLPPGALSTPAESAK